jgi:CheY-like chemotaxis protein
MILIAEDNPLMKKLLHDMLADLDALIVECADGKSACRPTSLLSNRLDKSIKQFETLSKKSKNSCKLPCGNFRYSTQR